MVKTKETTNYILQKQRISEEHVVEQEDENKESRFRFLHEMYLFLFLFVLLFTITFAHSVTFSSSSCCLILILVRSFFVSLHCVGRSSSSIPTSKKTDLPL